MTLDFRQYSVFYARNMHWVILPGHEQEALEHPWGFKPRMNDAGTEPLTQALAKLDCDASPVVTPAFEKASNEFWLSFHLHAYFQFIIAESRGELTRPTYAIPWYEMIKYQTTEISWIHAAKALHVRWDEFQKTLTGRFNIYSDSKARGYMASHESRNITSKSYKPVGSLEGTRVPLFGWTRRELEDQIHPSIKNFARSGLVSRGLRSFTKRIDLFPVAELATEHHPKAPWMTGTLSRDVYAVITKWKNAQPWSKKS